MGNTVLSAFVHYRFGSFCFFKTVAIYVCLFVSFCCCVFNFRGGCGVLLIVSDYVIYWLGVL